MASFGLLGAIGGAAQGAGQALQSQLEHDRKLRLEELRTSNTRETNRMSNEQRHEFSLAEQKASDELYRARQNDQNAWALENRNTGTEYGRRIEELRGLMPEATNDELINIAYGRSGSDGPGRFASGSVKPITELTPATTPDGELIYEENSLGERMPKMVERTVGYSWLNSNGEAETSYIDGRGAPQPAPGGATAPGGNTAPPAALEFLEKNKKNPDAVRQFKEKYGYLPEGVSEPAPSADQSADPAAPDSASADAPTDQGRQGKKYGASLDEIFGAPARATAGAALNAVEPIVDPIRQSMDKTAAMGEYQRYRQLGYWEKDIPVEVLEAVLPFLKGEDAQKVANVIADKKYSVATRN